MSLTELLRTPRIDTESPHPLSPDGRWLAFPANPNGQWEIFIQPAAGGPTRKVSDGPGAKSHPHWSPNSRQLAFVSDPTGAEEFTLSVYDHHSGVVRHLPTSFPVEPGLAWSPSGLHLAAFEAATGRLYLISIDSAQAQFLCDLNLPGRALHWSPNGRWLAASAETNGQDTGIFVISAADGTFYPLRDGDVPLPCDHPAFSPDSRWLAFSSFGGERATLGLLSLDDGQFSWLDAFPGDAGSPCWSPDAQQLVCAVTHGGTSHLAVVDLASGQRRDFHPPQPGVCEHPAFTSRGDALVFSFENPANPPGWWRLSLADGGMTRMAGWDAPPAMDAIFPEEVTYTSSDGQPVPALLFRSEAVLPAPAVVYIHGGPNWLTQVGWQPFFQHLLGLGWAILAPNYRGSIGYGRAWQLSNRFDPGGGDCEDILSAADFLVKSGIAHPRRIGVTGRSYGGYLTLMALTRAPQAWAAGSGVVPFLNFFNDQGIRPDVSRWDIENFGNPLNRPDFFRERSPLFHLDRVQAPLQLLCGAHDSRCPASDSMAAHQALTRQQKICELALYENEGHVFMNFENELDAFSRQVQFLSRYLTPQGDPHP